jgi:predicted permease
MRWLRRLWHKPLTEKQLDAELQFHLQEQIENYIATGLSDEEARRRALIEFGGVERFKEECREARFEHHLDVLWRDLRFAWRGLRKDPRFSIVAIFALALGIGASTAIFSVVDNALFEPLAYKDAGQLVAIKVRDLDKLNGEWRGLFSWEEYQEFAKQNHVFESMVANLQDDTIYTSGESNLRLGGNFVTPGTFEFYGVKPFLGRSLEPADYEVGAPPVFVMRYVTWVKRFNADPSWIGKTFNLNGVQRTLVGVAAPRFAWGGADLWMPRGREDRQAMGEGGHLMRRYWGVISRIRPGVSYKEASADLTVIAQRLAPQNPDDYPKHFAIEVDSFEHLVTPPNFRHALAVFSTAVGLLLLIGCGNVANLLLARATVREKEFAVRTAMGASRSRLIRQLLAESFLLAMGGATLGIFLAWAGVKALAAAMPDFTIASETVIEMNGAVLLFAVVTGVCTVFVFGLFPALQASRCDLSESLRDTGKGLTGTGRPARVRNAVVVLEVALSLTLLFTAGLFARTFTALQQVQLGIRIDHVLTARLPLPYERYKTGPQVKSFFGPLLARVKGLPGVEYAAETSTMPPYGAIRGNIEVEGKPSSDKSRALTQLCSEDYFSVIRIPLLEGRTFNQDEVNDARRVVVINRTFQHNYFGNENPIGRRVRLSILTEFPDPVPNPWFDVIGVVGDARNLGLEDPIDPETWIPYTVTGSAMRGILVRTQGNAASMTKPLAREIWAVDPGVAMAEAGTLEYFVDVYTFAMRRFAMWIVGIFAAIGLLLVTIGVYSVVSYTTSRRTHEIGIRMALGAARADVLRMVLSHGAQLLLLGIVVGLGLSLGAAQVIVNQLWGVSPHDPLTLGSVAALLLIVGLVACWIPARRATRTNPVNALRYE